MSRQYQSVTYFFLSTKIFVQNAIIKSITTSAANFVTNAITTAICNAINNIHQLIKFNNTRPADKILINCDGDVNGTGKGDDNGCSAQQVDNNNKGACMYKYVKIWSKKQHLQPYLCVLAKTPKFTHWIDQIIKENIFTVASYEVTDIDFFGQQVPEKLAFYKGKAEAYNKLGVKVASNICNNRGGCAACLIVVNAIINGQEKKLIPVVIQDRLASGGQREEIVAGMKDGVTGQLKGPIINEILQELPIDEISENDPRIILLGNHIWPSPGWSDETIDLWAIDVTITEDKYNYLKTGTFGEGAHEVIKIKFYNYEDFSEALLTIGDVKAECAFRRYELLKSANNHA